MKTTITSDQRKMLQKLAEARDSDIDTADIPEISDEKWNEARRTNFFRPLKHSVTIRLDADVVAWFKDHAEGGKYQTEMNQVLRKHMLAAQKRDAAE